MEYIKQKYYAALDLLASYKQPAELRSKEVQWHHVYLEQFLKLITWKNVDLTLKVLIFLQFLFWSISLWNLRPLSVIGVILLHFVILDSIFYEILLCKYTGEYREVIDEISQSVRSLLDTLNVVRRENKLLFTLFMSMNFFACCFISKNLSGYNVIALIVMIMFAAPLVISRLWAQPTGKHKRPTVLAEEELIPFIANKDFSAAVDAELESLLTDRTAESISNSFASGISGMPSYTEVVDNDSIVIGEDDLLPRYDSVSRGRTPSDSDSDNNKHDLSFESDHFKSSSSEDDIDGLKLKSKTDMTNTWLLNVANMGNALMSNLVNRSSTNEEVEQVSSIETDSDFEILDPDEIEN